MIRPKKMSSKSSGPSAILIEDGSIPLSRPRAQKADHGILMQDVTSGHRIDIDEHLRLFSTLYDRYKWPQSQWQPIETSIKRLTNRFRDTRLFLGVVGEFSSGKSTLINAFLREDLLKTDILPATTCAATVLLYGAKVDAEIIRKDGSSITFSRNGFSLWQRLLRRWSRHNPNDELNHTRKFIHRYTAEEDSANALVQVNVMHPNQALYSGLVIVDTPGINVDNPRHTDVTQRTIRDICDAVVVIVPAPAACSQTLICFLKEHLSEWLHRCFVIVTKIDLIPLRERSKLLNYISSRLERELGQPFAAVLPAAPRYILEGNDSAAIGILAEDVATFREQFLETEKTTFDVLARSRVQIIAEELQAIVIQTLTQLERAVCQRKVEYCQGHEALEQNRIPNLSGFVEAHKEDYRKELKQLLRQIDSEVKGRMKEFGEQLGSQIASDIMNASSMAELKTIMTDNFKTYFTTAFEEIRQLSGTVCAIITERAQLCHDKFQSDFAKYYRALATLGGSIAVEGVDYDAAFQTQILIIGQASQAADQVGNAVSDSHVAATVGTGVGAALGTFILPGVGTAIGAGLGWLASKLFGPSLEELQQSAISDTNRIIINWIAECAGHIKDIIHTHTKQTLGSLDTAIDHYTAVYDAKVNEMIQQDKKATEQLEQYIVIAEKDLDILRRRAQHARTLLDSIRLNAIETEVQK